MTLASLFLRFIRTCVLLQAFLAFVIACPLAAQEYIAKVEHYSVEQGLSHRQVNAICQDSRGFIWLGTLNGLNRFDGYSFRTYTKEKDGLFFNDYRMVMEDAEGWLWLTASMGREICLFHPESGKVLSLAEKFGTQYPDFVSARFFGNQLRDEEGGLWLSVKDTGLVYRYHPVTGVQAFPIEGLRNILPVYYSRDKTIWAVADGQIVVELSRTGKVLQRFEGLWLYGDWAITENGILTITVRAPGKEDFHYISLKGEQLPYQPPGLTKKNAPYPAFILPFDDKGIFLIHDQLVHPQRGVVAQWEFVQHDRNNFMWRSFLKDRSGRYWIGDDFGFYILQIKKNRFRHYFYKNGAKPALGNTVRGILVADDKIYANLENHGFFEQDLRGGESRRIEAFGNGWGNYGLTFSKNGQIWSGKGKWLFRWTPGASSAEKIPTLFDGWAFCEDKTGTCWIGSSAHGLHTFAPGAAKPEPFTRYNEFGALSTAFILHIEQDESGFLWVCANNGFYKVDPQKGVVARYWAGGSGEYFLPAENFLHFHRDADGVFWFATGSGLVRAASRRAGDGSISPFWDEQSGKLFNRTNSLSNDFIYAVYEDRQGKLWMPTDHGIVCLDKKTEAVKTYFVSDGITDAEFNRKSHFQASDGTLYFGGLNGVNAFNPADFNETADEQHEAPLVLTAFYQLDGKLDRLADRTAELLKTRTIVLRPDDRFFNLELALLSFNEPQLIQYAWKIEGLEKDWHYQKERQVNFGGLPYGTYTLHIKAQAADGVWSKKELVFTVRVLRPWFLQAWFLVLAALLLGLGVRVYIRRRSRQHFLEQKKLEGLVTKATERIEQDKRTIEKQAEELRHLDKVKSNFFANVSHELRTPLSLLLGPIGTMIKRSRLENQDFTLAKLAQVHARQLLQLVNQILDLSKLESGKLELHESPVLLYPLLRRIVAAFESHADQRGIRFVFQFQPEKDLRILVDAAKMETILNNLLSNALKFTPSEQDGMVSLTVENRAHTIRLTVSDTGRGIHPDDLPHVFNRFYQSEQPNAPTEGGTGIGLALCKELAELMQGRIWAESPEPGAGSRFFLEIPQKEVLGVVDASATDDTGEADLLPDLAAVVSAGGEQKAHTVLVVEDNKSLRDYIQLILSEKYHVATAENGQVAWSMMNEDGQTTPHLIISDIMMPVMDGFQLLESLKCHAQYQQIPVIMLTARAEVQDQLRALRIGVDDYLLKPFEEEELLARVAALLEGFRGRERWRAEAAGLAGANAPAETPEPAAGEPTASELIWLEELETLVRRELHNDQISVGWLAGRLYLSERQLQRRINTLTGLAPNAYIREVRLQEARHLLEQRRVQSLKEAAWAVGFRDEKHFSQIFRERFGKSPADLLR
ncbi:MAG: response regulator [Saprospiraceae bacterium]|nr:response regulator [Saprospiraceae bacterium]